jgi:hypothetical protein
MNPCTFRQQESQGNTQAYRYDSPYVFASANNYEISGLGYSQIAQGLGNVYFVDNFSNSVVAVDVHTGAEASRSAPSSADGSTAYMGESDHGVCAEFAQSPDPITRIFRN